MSASPAQQFHLLKPMHHPIWRTHPRYGWIVLSTSLKTENIFPPLCTEPLYVFLLIKDFVLHSLGLVICFPLATFWHLLCSGSHPELTSYLWNQRTENLPCPMATRPSPGKIRTRGPAENTAKMFCNSETCSKRRRWESRDSFAWRRKGSRGILSMCSFLHVASPLDAARPLSGLPGAFSSLGCTTPALSACPRTEVLHPLNRLRGPPLDELQQLHVSPVLRTPHLDAALQVSSHSTAHSRGAGSPPFPCWPHCLDQDTGFLVCKGTLLAHVQLLPHTSMPKSFLLRLLSILSCLSLY